MHSPSTPPSRTGLQALRISRAAGSALLAALAVSTLAATASANAVTSASTSTGSAHKAVVLKAPIHGLLDRHGQPRPADRPAINGVVVATTWAALQPVANGPIVRSNAIDKAIAVAQTTGEQLKLRVDVATGAPAWAKQLGGSPMTFVYTNATPGKSASVAGTIGRFWTPKFGAAYDQLQSKLAALYDKVPQIREESADRCQTIFPETYLRDAGATANKQALLAAGFTTAADAICHQQTLTEAAAVWKHTLTEVTFNPYQSISPSGKVTVDLAYTEQQMRLCRTILGPRCVLANYSLASKRLTGGNYGAMYAYMKQLGAPIDFQTDIAARIGDYQQVLKFAAQVGASSVELPSGYAAWSVPTLVKAGAALPLG